MSVHAFFDGVKINDLVKFTFSGSSSPLVLNMPRGIGTLLKPSGSVSRTITLTSQRFVSNNKTEIETLQHDLNELLIMKGKKTLVVDGVAYPNAVSHGTEQDILYTNEYMSYSLKFELDKDQPLFGPALVDGRIRDGSFSAYGGTRSSFPIFDSYEAGISAQYNFNQKPKTITATSTVKYPTQGYEAIRLDCWMVGQLTNDFQRYMSDYLMDPLGKRGVLNLNGLVFQNAILVSVNSSPPISSTMKYTLEFHATLAC